jgi:hypothetical protein
MKAAKEELVRLLDVAQLDISHVAHDLAGLVLLRLRHEHIQVVAHIREDVAPGRAP